MRDEYNYNDDCWDILCFRFGTANKSQHAFGFVVLYHLFSSGFVSRRVGVPIADLIVAVQMWKRVK